MKREHLPHTRCFYTEAPDSPKPRNFTNEILQTITGLERAAPRQYALESQYQPLYTGLGLRNQAIGQYGYDEGGEHIPGSLELGAAGRTYNRGSDLADVAMYGPSVTAAQLQANPTLARGLGMVSQRMDDTPILRLLNSQAEGQLQAGGRLSPQEERQLRESSRSSYADRGMYGSNGSLAAEILNRDAAVRQRQQAAQQFAGQVQSLNQQQNDFVGRGTQIASTALADPFSVLLGRSGGAYAGGGGGGGTQTIGTGGQMFNATNPYAADIYNTNYNAEAAHNIEVAHANNTNYATWANLAANLFLSDDRLKTDVKRTGRKTADDIPIKRFKYITDDEEREYEGVMASDVEKRRPDAVVRDPVSGVKAVDYGAIAAPFRQILNAA